LAVEVSNAQSEEEYHMRAITNWAWPVGVVSLVSGMALSAVPALAQGDPLLPIIYSAEGEIDAPFEAILNQPNVIAVHQSSEEYATIVACGNVVGVDFAEEDEVVVGLPPVNASGVRGYAIFENDPVLFGDDRTEVTVYLFDRLPSRGDIVAAGTPAP
jgi:hypothetical protein